MEEPLEIGLDAVIYRKSDGIAEIVLNRPRMLNAYDMEMRDQLYQVLAAIKEDPEVRVGILRGEGRAFCAGADLTEFGTAPSQAIARQVRWERDLWGAFLGISKPLIAAIHGYCLGSGVEIALLCDLRLAASDALFGMPEVSLGMIPAAGGTQTMPRTLGIPRAMEMLLAKREVGAVEAYEIGLVTRVVDRSKLDIEAKALARHLAELSPRAVSALREAVWQGAQRPMDESMDLEARLAIRALALE